MKNKLIDIITAHKNGRPVGICSVCSANRFVIKAAFDQAKKDNQYALIESTSNQVDQFGGYTGMAPQNFRDYVYDLAREMDFPAENIILGGDHLGPNVWQNEPADRAIENAVEQIKAYINAGYSKIHLDASMPLLGDDVREHHALDPQLCAERAAQLCLTAEKAWKNNADLKTPPVYVIGTDVPIPGGAVDSLDDMHVTTVDEVNETIDLTKTTFRKHGLEDAWERVVAVVVQPGVEFSNLSVIEYDPERCGQLPEAIEQRERMVYEAHSTDYQTLPSLRRMVKDHFAILKVGPELTFAFREALFALAGIEEEWLGGSQTKTSGLIPLIENVMIEYPRYWAKHYHGSEAQKAFARKYSFSDRIRYYWPYPQVQQAVALLIENLTRHSPPLTLLSQYLPFQYQAVREKAIANTPLELINHKICQVLQRYNQAVSIGGIDIVPSSKKRSAREG